MGDLGKLSNIRNVMERRLAAVGINDVDTLMKIGSKEAFIKLRLHEGILVLALFADWRELFKICDGII